MMVLGLPSAARLAALTDEAFPFSAASAWVALSLVMRCISAFAVTSMPSVGGVSRD